MKSQISANWQWATVDEHEDHAERWVLSLSDREALRKAIGFVEGVHGYEEFAEKLRAAIAEEGKS